MAAYSLKIQVVALALACLAGCKAKLPGAAEEKVATEAKQVVIGGKDWANPVPASAESIKTGGGHFQHHCQVCHGLDGQNTGVPFALKMSPPVADLSMKDVQNYSDGQLKWIIQNGIRFSGMPGWKGILEDKEMWNIVNYLRHLPPPGSLGTPTVFKESEAQHEGRTKGEPNGNAHHH